MKVFIMCMVLLCAINIFAVRAADDPDAEFKKAGMYLTNLCMLLQERFN